MGEPEPVGTIVKRIMKEMMETIINTGGDPGPIELWDEPPRPAPLPKPILRLIKGGKENPCGIISDSSD
jgi:hypothetical protein